MYKNKKIVAIIPARGGSKGVPNKNIKMLAGKPLITYTIEESLKSKHIDRTIVSTENKKIAEISKKYGAEIIERPTELADDDTPTLPVLKHAVNHLEKVEGYSADIVVLLQPTSPLRKVSDIDIAIEKFLKSDADLVVSVIEMKHHPFWSFEIDGDKLRPFVKDGFKTIKRQDLPRVYTVNGAIYVMSAERARSDSIFGGDMRAVVMSEEKSVDIDTPLDFKITELLIKELNKNGKNKDC